MGSWSFLTNHARVLLCIAHDPGVRLRDIAASAGITERSAYGIVTDLTTAGYVTKEKDGRRNRYQIQPHMPLPEPGGQGTAIGEVLAVLAGAGQPVTRPAPGPDGSQQYHEAGGRSRPEFAAPPVVAGRTGAWMSSPSQPAHLSNHHRSTMRQIFQHPAGHNIEWHAVLSLLEAVGSAEEQPGGKVAVTIGSQTEYFDPPSHKDIDTQAVVNLRRMLTQAGYGPGTTDGE